MVEVFAQSIMFLLKAAVVVLWMTTFVSGEEDCTDAACSITLEEGETKDFSYPTGLQFSERLSWNIETDENLKILVRVPQPFFWPADVELSLREPGVTSDYDELYSVHDYNTKIIASEYLLSRGHSIQLQATIPQLTAALPSLPNNVWFQATAYSVRETSVCGPNSNQCRTQGRWQYDAGEYTYMKSGNGNTRFTLTINIPVLTQVKGTGFLTFNYILTYTSLITQEVEEEEGRVTLECLSSPNVLTPGGALTIVCTTIQSQITFTADGAAFINTITVRNITVQDAFVSKTPTDQPDSSNVQDADVSITPTDEPDSSDLVVPLAIGVVLGVLLIIVTIILVLVLCRVRKREKSNRPSRKAAAENGLQNPAFSRGNEYAENGEYHEYNYPSLPELQKTDDDPANHQYDELSRSDMDTARLDVASNSAHFSSASDQDYSRIGDDYPHGEQSPEARPPDTKLTNGGNGYETPTLLSESANHQQSTQSSTEANTPSLVDQKLYQHLNRPETPYSESTSTTLSSGNGTGTDGYGKLNLTSEAPNQPENTIKNTALPENQDDRAKSTSKNSEAEHPKVSDLATDSDDYLAVSMKPPPAAVVRGSTDDYEIPTHLSKSGDHPETQDDSSKLPMSNSETEQLSDVAKDNEDYLVVSVKPPPAATAGLRDEYETPTLLSQSSANQQAQPLPDADAAGLVDERLYQHLDRSQTPFSQDSTSGTTIQNEAHADDYGKLKLPN